MFVFNFYFFSNYFHYVMFDLKIFLKQEVNRLKARKIS